MSYCRFENTLKDLQDCYKALQNNTIDSMEEMSAIEFNSMVRLVDLCYMISDEFDHFLTCVPENE
jgi:hypothetical protein